ncbi:MAG: hypothetical protein ACFCUM_17575 [Bacteroidales bacterium]
MSRETTYIPVYRQLIDTARRGFELLDDRSQEQVLEFIVASQDPSGSFTDRSKTPDMYYSLFGVWLSKALGLKDCIEKHRSFVSGLDPKLINRNKVDIYIFILIRLILMGKDKSRPSALSMLSLLSGKGKEINLVYRMFFFLLIYDAAYNHKGLMKLLAYLPLTILSPSTACPCSNIAAIIIAKNYAGINTSGDANLLMKYFREGDGFMVFPDAESSDLLSTAVSLFSLKKSGADLRLLVPDCLGFINDTYREGAFVSGDGDEIRDLEYTFYGLLALGSLN